MWKRFASVLLLLLVIASCSSSVPSLGPDNPAPRVELAALALFERDGVGNVLGSTSWKTWAKDGTAWIQRVATKRDSKPGETESEWEARGMKWVSRETRWHVQLPEGWWADAERLAGEHRFFALSEELRPQSGPEAGNDHPTIQAISRNGARRKVSKWANDRMPEFDALYAHLKRLRKQTESAKPEYEGEATKDWQPPDFPSEKETPLK
jgi:hypothetical protein